MAKPKQPGNGSVVQRTAKPSDSQAYQREVQRGLRNRRADAQRAARMGGPQLPLSPRDTTGKATVIPTDSRGVVQLPLPLPFSPSKKAVTDAVTGKLKSAPLKKTLGKTVASVRSGGGIPPGYGAGQSDHGVIPVHAPIGHAGAGAGAGAGQGSGAGLDPTSLFTQLLKEAGGIGTLLNPNSYANAVAGGKDDPTISTLQQQQKMVPIQGAQDQADIANWYGQVKSSMLAAGASEKQANAAAIASTKDATQGIMASLGGAANGGNEMVGAQGANAAGTEAALGNIQQSYLANMGPLLDLAQSGAASADKARSHQLAQNIALQLAQAQGQRSNDYQVALAQATQQNSDTQQRRLGDKAGFIDSLISAENTGNSNMLKQLVDNSVISKNKQEGTAAISRAQTARYKALHPTASTKGTFAAMDPAKKLALAAAILQGVKGQGGNKNIHGAFGYANAQIAGLGFDPNDPTVRTWRNTILSQAGINPTAGTIANP